MVRAVPPMEPSPSLSMADIMDTAWAPPVVPSSSKDGAAAARVMGAMFGPKAQGEAAVPSSSPEPARPSCAAPRPSSAVAEFDIGTPRSRPEDAASSGDPVGGATGSTEPQEAARSPKRSRTEDEVGTEGTGAGLSRRDSRVQPPRPSGIPLPPEDDSESMVVLDELLPKLSPEETRAITWADGPPARFKCTSPPPRRCFSGLPVIVCGAA